MTASNRKDIVGLQLLRAIAAFTVLAQHAGFEIWKSSHLDNPVKIGSFGVDLFFVLSGLVMWISTRSAAPGSTSAVRFLTKRFLRVTPLYWAITLFMAILFKMAPSLSNTDQLANGHLWKSLAYFPQVNWPILIVGWTLSHEMFFYLLFSLKLIWKRGLYLVIASLFAFGLVGWLLPRDGTWEWYGLVFSPFQFEFLMGIACGWLYERQKLPSLWLPLTAILILGIVGCQLELSRWILWGGIGLASCLAFLKSENVWRKTPRSLLVLGESSYALYLIHLPVVTLIARFVRGEHIGAFHRWTALVGTLVFCEVAAILVWKLFDEPVQTWIGNRLRRIF